MKNAKKNNKKTPVSATSPKGSKKVAKKVTKTASKKTSSANGRKKTTTKRSGSKQRYFGIVKIKRGEKLCWIAKEFSNGWSLGLALNNRNVWLTGLRFADRKELERVGESSVVFVHMRNSKDLPEEQVPEATE